MEEVMIDETDEEEFSDAMADFAFYDCEEQFCDDPLEADACDSGSVTLQDQILEEKVVHPVSLRRRRRSMKSTLTGDSEGSSTSSISIETKEPRKILENEISESVVLSNGLQGPEREIDDPPRVVTPEQDSGENGEGDTGFLFLLAGLMVKAISLQVHYSFKVLFFPIKFMFRLYTIVVDPFGFMDHCKGYFMEAMRRILELLFGLVSSSVRSWLIDNKDLLRFTFKCGWGLLWASYVCIVLVMLLLSSFLFGGMLVNHVVKEPIRMKSSLNFDYTQKSPAAFVPILAEENVNHDIYIGQEVKMRDSGRRVIPVHHKLHFTVSLRLPESEYNHALGIFQVRVDFLDHKGNNLASSRRPCMLLYRSQTIHLLMTVFKLASVLTGYSSETQTLKVVFKGLIEGDTPTSAIRVVLEQRAEYLHGAGIPEIYDAYLFLESELPLLKRLLWFWKKTLFVWISMTIFIMELAFSLICCKPVIMPRIRLRQAINQQALPTDN